MQPNMIRVIPKYYTTEEGGYWKPWPQDLELLKEILDDYSPANNLRNRITLAGKQIHSLAFGEYDIKDFPRWDCINGWTTPIEKG